MPLHLPNLYVSANAASLAAQSEYKRIVGLGLMGGATASVLALLASLCADGSSPVARSLHAICAAFTLLIVLGAIFLAVRRPDQRWYMSRAVAESIKSVAWRHATKAAPFNTSDDVATGNLIAIYKGLLAYAQQAQIILPAGENDYITDGMGEFRQLPYIERLNRYLIERVDDQRQWYSTKAKAASTSVRRWFTAIVILYSFSAAVAVLAAVYAAPFPSSAAAVLLVFASSAMTWLQVRRDQELGRAYSLTAHELGLVRLSAKYVKTESAFGDYVADAESAMSREHTTWLARRDVYPGP